MKTWTALVIGAYLALVWLAHLPFGYGLLPAVALLILGWKIRNGYRAERGKQARHASHDRLQAQTRQLYLAQLAGDLHALERRRAEDQ